MRVSIVGCGPSGLNAAKSVLEEGLRPTIYEKTDQIGGVWRRDNGLTWQSMSTNVSRFNFGFSDYEWPAESGFYPSTQEVAQYYDNYAKHFNLLQYIKFNSKVVQVKQLSNKKWLVRYENTKTGETKEYESDFLIVSAGIFAKPKIPTIKNREKYTGLTIHSKDYQEFKLSHNLKDKKVVVIGAVASGPNICEELAKLGVDVTSLIQRPKWFLKKYVNNPNNEGKKIPYEFGEIFSRQKSKLMKSMASSQMIYKLINQNFSKYCEDQLQVKELYIDPDSEEPQGLSVVDNYVSLIREGKIKLVKNDIKCYYEKGLVLNDESKLEADIIIFGTGYFPDLSFMDEEILNKLEYDENDNKLPLILYRNTIRPELENLAFIGIFREPFAALLELQGRWAAKLFAGKLKLPDKEIIEKDLQHQRDFRKVVPRPQLVHPDFIGYPDEMAIELKMLPDFEKLKESDPDLYNLFYKAAPALAFYRLTENRDLALKIINDANKEREKYF